MMDWFYHMTPLRKSHNDSQIEVAGNGTIYAG